MRHLLPAHFCSPAARVPSWPKVRSASALPDLLCEPQSALRDVRLPSEPLLPLSLHVRPLDVHAGYAPRPPEVCQGTGNSAPPITRCTGDSAPNNTTPPADARDAGQHAHKTRWLADSDEDGYLFSSQSAGISHSPDYDTHSTRSGDTREHSGTDAESAFAPSRCGSPPVWNLPLALPGASNSVFIRASGCPDVVTDIDQPDVPGFDQHCRLPDVLLSTAIVSSAKDCVIGEPDVDRPLRGTHGCSAEQLTDPSQLSQDDLLAMFDVCSMTQGDCSRACDATAAQQHICTLRQVGAAICEHSPLFEHCIAQTFGERKVPSDLRSMFLQLEHSLAKAATTRVSGDSFCKGHSVRLRFGKLRNDFAAVLGKVALQTLAMLKSDVHAALSVMKVAVGSFFIRHPELACGYA